MQDAFAQRKRSVLEGLEANCGDKSRKGSVDAPIVSLIELINAQPDLFTTSSCSGRVSVFAEPTEATRAAGKKGGEWVFASHERSDPDEVLRSVKERMGTGARLILRFEPFILHAECRDLDTAMRLLVAARNGGYRESGATFGSAGARVMVAVRCSLRLEVPIADTGVLLCPDEYVRYMVRLANDKFTSNEERVAKLEEQIREAFKESRPEKQQQQQQQHRRPQHRHEQVRGAARSQSHAAAALAPARPSLPETRQTGSLEPVKRLLGHQLQLLKRLKALEKVAAGGGQRPAAGKQAVGERQAVVVGAGGAAAVAGAIGSLLQQATQVQGQAQVQGQVQVQDPAQGQLAWEALPCGLEYRPQNPLQAQAAARQQQQQVQQQRRKHAQHNQQQRKQPSVAVNGNGAAGGHPGQAVMHTANGPIQASGSPLVPVAEFDSILRWGHAAVSHEGRLVVIGGYGGEGAHMRRGDVLLYEPSGGQGSAVEGQWRIVAAGGGKGLGPSARMCHAAVVLGDHALVVGGRASPTCALGDVWRLDLRTWQWQELKPRVYLASDTAIALGHEPQWPARFRHAAATDGRRVYVWGGTDGSRLHDDLWMLEQQRGHEEGWAWTQIPAAGPQAPWPAARKSHAMAVAGGRLYVHGGMQAYGQHLRDMHCLDLAQVTAFLETAEKLRDTGGHGAAGGPRPGVAWRLVEARGSAPAACFSHALTSWARGSHAPGLLLLTGGHPSPEGVVFAFDVASETWSSTHVQQPPRAAGEFVPVRHSATILPWPAATPSAQLPSAKGQLVASEVLVLVGGGAFCFSFGTVFSRPWMVPLQPLLNALGQQPQPSQALGRVQAAAAATGGAPMASGDTVQQGGRPSSSRASNNAQTGGMAAEAEAEAVGDSEAAWVLEVPALLAKAAKDAVKACGWLDQSRRAGQGVSQPGEQGQAAPSRVIALPLLAQGASAIATAQQGQGRGLEELPEGVCAALAGGALLCQRHLPDSSRCGLDPKQAMRAAAESVLAQHAVDGALHSALLADLPHKWERLGDLALIPASSLVHSAWLQVLPDMQPLWVALAQALGVQRLARQAPVANTGTRDSRAVLLLGDDAWVSHREGGVTFCLDVTRCMYSSGNVTERLRMGRMDCSGQTVVDLYTGIGYYTLPVLVSAGAAKVFACEWNPHAVQALRRNLDVNGVSGRCEVRHGDCRQVAPRCVADRVLLGLLPSSQGGWETAVQALKDSGGCLHVHENVKDAEEAGWVEQAASRFQAIARTLPGRGAWLASVQHVERVKWYAPHVRHIVVDLQLGPPQ